MLCFYVILLHLCLYKIAVVDRQEMLGVCVCVYVCVIQLITPICLINCIYVVLLIFSFKLPYKHLITLVILFC